MSVTRNQFFLFFLFFVNLKTCFYNNCNADFVRGFYSCTDAISNLDQFKDQVIYFKVKKAPSGLNVSDFSETATDDMKTEINKVIDCMVSDTFLDNETFHIVYMHLEMPDSYGMQTLKDVTRKFKKKHNIKNKTCTVNSWYTQTIQ